MDVPKVGLAQHEGRGDQDERDRRQKPDWARCAFGGEPIIIGGEGQNEGNLHQLGRLQPHEPKVDPTLRPHADAAHDFDKDQEEHGSTIGEPR